MNRRRNFYGSGFGDRLIDPAFFPDEIRQFLRDEQTIVESVGSLFDLLVEIGCMHGRYLKWSVLYGKRYLGIDVVLRYIDDGSKAVANLGLSPKDYRFILGGAEEINKLVEPEQLLIKPERCLLLFPFNSFGNISDPLPVIKSLKESELPFLISSYSTAAEATACREQYYRNCGYRELRPINNERGVCFVSSEGLHSMAYHPQYLQDLCMAYGLNVATLPFSQIGMAYTTVTIRSILHNKL